MDKRMVLATVLPLLVAFVPQFVILYFTDAPYYLMNLHFIIAILMCELILSYPESYTNKTTSYLALDYSDVDELTNVQKKQFMRQLEAEHMNYFAVTIFAPIFEEILFRTFPLFVSGLFTDNYIPISVLSTILFSLNHTQMNIGCIPIKFISTMLSGSTLIWLHINFGLIFGLVYAFLLHSYMNHTMYIGMQYLHNINCTHLTPSELKDIQQKVLPVEKFSIGPLQLEITI